MMLESVKAVVEVVQWIHVNGSQQGKPDSRWCSVDIVAQSIYVDEQTGDVVEEW